MTIESNVIQRFFKCLFVQFISICITSSAFSQDMKQAQGFASVDFSHNLQVWDGFGVNYVQAANSVDYATNPQDYGGFRFLTKQKQNEIIDLVFGDTGLQPSLVKMFLDPLHFNEKTGKYDHEFTTSGMRYFVQEGKKLSSKRQETLSVIATLYGPPAWATMQKQLNGRDLDFARKEQLADYLASWLKYLQKENLPAKYISLFNEADKPHGYNKEGTVKPDDIFDYNTFWTPGQVAEFMVYLRDFLDRNQLQTIGITPGECSSWLNFNARLYDWTIAANSDAIKALSLITCHSFGNSATATPAGVNYIRSYKPEIHAWVTSASWGNNDLHMPEQIALNINSVKVNAYIPWAVVQTPTQWYMGNDPNAAPPIRVSENGTYELTTTYYLYKQFTRAGKAGMTIAPVTTPSPDIDLVAFASNGTNNPNAFVVINKNNWAGKTIAIRIAGTKSNAFKAIRTWRKYGIKTMEEYAPIGDYKIENSYILYECPPHSVTTFYEVQ